MPLPAVRLLFVRRKRVRGAKFGVFLPLPFLFADTTSALAPLREDRVLSIVGMPISAMSLLSADLSDVVGGFVNVLLRRERLKMSGVTARRVAALVMKMEHRVQSAEAEFVAEPVRHMRAGIPRAEFVFPIAMLGAKCRPDPASAGVFAVDLGEKPFKPNRRHANFILQGVR